MTKARKTFLPLTSENICEIYNLLHKEGLISFPATPDSKRKVEATVANVTGANFGIDNYQNIRQKVVAHLYFLIKNHPFVDGNKRTAVLVFLVLCGTNGLVQKLKGYNLDALAIFLETYQGQDHQMVIKVVADSIFES